MIYSIDVEDWGQSVLDNNNPVSDRVLNSTSHILDLLDEYEQKGTFFIFSKKMFMISGSKTRIKMMPNNAPHI